MNFFAHAVVAAGHDPSPRFVLGAMLPDLAHMAGTRLRGSSDAGVADGIRFHHTTDGVFHRHPVFTASCTAAVADLCAVGLQRGPARAVAHVGFELLLDGAISRDGSGLRAYRAALEFGRGEPGLAPQDGPAGTWTAITRVLERLADAPVPQAYDDPAFVAQRLQTILAPRPRLALSPADLAPMARWCIDAQPPIQRVGAELTAEVAGAAALAFTDDS